MLINSNSKKAQVGSTITWIVATVIIVVVLLITVFVANSLGKSKDIEYSQEKDTLASKSFFSWLLTEQDGERIYVVLGREKNLNDSNGDLAQKVFEGYYGEEYNGIWVGMRTLLRGIPRGSVQNVFFGSRPELTREGYQLSLNLLYGEENVVLNQNSSVEVILKNE